MNTKTDEPDSAQMGIAIVTIRVDDWAGMVTFYRDKLGVKMSFVDEPNQYAMFDTGPVRLALEGPVRPAFAKRDGKSPVTVNFQVSRLAETLDRLRSNGVSVLTDVRSGPGYDYVAFADSEGNEQIVFQRRNNG